MLRALSHNISRTMVRQYGSSSILSKTKASHQLLNGRVYPAIVESVGRMFSVQQSLPRLPVPPLQQSLDRLLATSKPLLSDSEYEHCKKLVADFSQAGGEGEKLQKLLEERASKHINWLEDWWLNMAYLEFRMPCALHVNPGILMPSANFNSVEDQVKYAARLVAGVLDYKSMIDDQSLPVEKLRNQPLCMKQFYAILSTCRIPGTKKDTIVNFPPNEPNPPTHIVVLHNNHIFAVDVYGSDGRPLSPAQITEQLTEVVKQSQNPTDALGILTTENRNTWGKVYDLMSKDPSNVKSFEKIQRSIFALCLDQPVQGMHEDNKLSKFVNEALHGGGSKNNTGNRWFDKTMQFFVSRDGGIGLCYEHAPAEGPPIMSIVNHTVKYLEKGERNEAPVAGMKKPEKLDFKITDSVKASIEAAAEAIDSQIQDLDMNAFFFDEYGKDFVKTQKMSPDSYIQTAFQLTIQRLHGQNFATYESGSLRRFQHGRTDTIRSCSIESDAFVKAMDDKSVAVNEKATLFRNAVNAHRAYTDAVVSGQGIDRHFLGLKLSAVERGMNVPALLMDPVFAATNTWRLSTSQVPSPHPVALGFAPVVPDGYGVCYNPMEKSFFVNVSAWDSSPETSSKRFINTLRSSFLDIQKVLLSQSKL